jgi:tetratricopeptide (TPR) repeat protein
MADRDEVIGRLDPTLLDTTWNFDDPAGSEAIFRKHLATLDPHGIAAAELATQIARALGLQGRFDEADAVLDGIASEHPVVEARVNLERGRIRNSGGDPAAAVPLFLSALDHARIAGNDYLAVDALHMLAIIDQPRAGHWMRQGIALTEASADPRTRRWQGALHNNLGWTLHDNEDFGAALVQFEHALAAYEATGTPEQVHIAQWTIARCLRSLGREEEALTIQERLAADDPPDAWVADEIAILKGTAG